MIDNRMTLGPKGLEDGNESSQRKEAHRQVLAQLRIDLEDEAVTFSENEIEALLENDRFTGYSPETYRELIPDRFRQNLDNFQISASAWKRAIL